MAQARVQGATDLKEVGSTAFRNGDIKEACTRYEEALCLLRPGLSDTEIAANEGLSKEHKLIKISCLLNAAICYSKLGVWDDAAAKADVVLDLDPLNVKAMFHRGRALAKQGELERARDDLQDAARLDPKNKAAKKELEAVLEKLGLTPSKTISIEDRASWKITRGRSAASR